MYLMFVQNGLEPKPALSKVLGDVSSTISSEGSLLLQSL